MTGFDRYFNRSKYNGSQPVAVKPVTASKTVVTTNVTDAVSDSDNFEKAVDYVLVNEGGYSNDPNDSGGATNMGITHSDLANFLGTPVTDDDVRAMSKSTACAIYRKSYWDPIQGDKISNLAIATCIFDSGVLYGVETSIIYAQQSLNALDWHLTSDGALGSQTLNALNTVDPKQFIVAFHARIITRINSIIENNPKDEEFRNGWIARADRLLTLV